MVVIAAFCLGMFVMCLWIVFMRVLYVCVRLSLLIVCFVINGVVVLKIVFGAAADFGFSRSVVMGGVFI